MLVLEGEGVVAVAMASPCQLRASLLVLYHVGGRLYRQVRAVQGQGEVVVVRMRVPVV